MDLRRVKNEDKLNICKKYYLGGFALLPFLWVVNGIWFFRDAFLAPEFEQQKKIKSYVIQSLIGAGIWIVGLVTWITLFQLNRVSWGATADKLLFTIPKGIP